MQDFPVKALPSSDNGRLLVRLNIKYRDRILRYGIGRLTNSRNAKPVKTLLLGHDDDTAIFMPYDIREALGVSKGGSLSFTLQKVSWLGKVWWLLRTPDPAVQIPALLAVISVILGILGVVISFRD